MITLTSAEAQNNFGKLLDTAQREPVAITRHGRPAAYVVSPEDMKILDAASKRNRTKAAAALEAWRILYGDQISPEAANLTDEDIVRMVHEARDEAARTV
ncbi:type II toxin-antitoxin system Phd/YefM family antitoxin [Terracidiphilus gabretensis]|jgi:antitoxin Phd|uniref:type II toxin-antitoxin system Phd/YefM family antitoxin n=1 Tax=Terracidiphilus gabretensis TaxID=1577687 RepID=UPI00071B98E6|nr:type II toxin-antitoxin system Phd/YefM family antitoxin [Terracidiphilus gabretensis]